MLLLNIGSRFVIEDISKSQEEWFSNQVLRRLVIFAICFIATRDVVTSVVLTAGFIIFTSGIMASDSHPMSVLPKMSNSGPFGNVRTYIPGLSPVANPAHDDKAPVIFTS